MAHSQSATYPSRDAARPFSPSPAALCVFYAFLAVLTLLSLYPIWMNRLLPMQDYPQHLFLAHVIATYEDPAYNWKSFYTVDLTPGPYMLWYLAMKPLSLFLGVEVAGKLLFSLYILLISLLTHLARRLCPQGTMPWGALLLFPFAFNQIYFMGFPNYILSLPLLMLAVLDLEAFARGRFPGWRIALHGLYLVLIYLSHPYTVLVYVCLAATTALCFRDRRDIAVPLLTPAFVVVGVLLVWYLFRHGPSPGPNPYAWHLTWLPPNYSLLYLVLMFTGGRLTNGVAWFSLAAWSVVVVSVAHAWRTSRGHWRDLKLPLSLSGVTIAGYFVLPFWFGYYSYFNLRLAPVCYFLLALVCARLTMGLAAGGLVGASAALLVLHITATQVQVAKESESLIPLLANMNRNALVLPLLFDEGTTIIDPVFFGEFHKHEPGYYHVIVGGGANPTLFPSSMLPVQYRAGIRLPVPGRPDLYSWQEHGRYYDYVLLRGAPANLLRLMQPYGEVIATSGPWALFKTTEK